MTQPPLVIPSDVEVAQAGKSLLANGSALYTLASDDFEVLRVTFVFRAGSAMGWDQNNVTALLIRSLHFCIG